MTTIGGGALERQERRAGWSADRRYQQLVDLAPDAIFVHDGEHIVLANAAAARLAGATTHDQLIGLPVGTFLNPPYLKGVQLRLLHPDRAGDPSPPVVDVFRRLDSTEVPVEVHAVLIMDHGRPSAHLIVRDITDRRAAEQAAHQLEQRMQQAQRMEAVGALAGGVAHEVNNMMSVVLGFGEFLLRDPKQSPEALADVGEIVKAADRAAAVTRQLLAFSRRSLHRPRVVDLGAAVHAADPVLRRLIGQGREVILDIGTAPHIWVDPDQLEQVIVNLALNARDAMAGGGTLSLAVTEVELGDGAVAADGVSIPAGRYARLAVHDTGAGMDAATRARIFEPFFTTKPQGQGTGLGLAAVHGILTQSCAYITVDSAPGQGTTFGIYLPAYDPAADTECAGGHPAGVQTAPAAERRAGGTVLVVDDEPAVRAIASRSLEYVGFRVVQASDGNDALELIARYGPPDIVVTDVMMPGMGGAELARRLRVRWPEMPLVFMSGFSAEDLQREGTLGAGGELIQKPFTPDTLVEAVSGALFRAGVHGPPLLG